MSTINRDALRAHDEWLRRNRQGAGQLNVRGVDATGADLQAAKLAGARLERVDLRRAILDYADLRDSELTGCQLEGVRMSSTHFEDARITDCSFEGATGEIANLDGATIRGARFDRARLHTSQWPRAVVTSTSFVGAAFGNAVLDGAQFVDCDFRGALLGPTRENPPHSMRGATFENCDFRDVDFTRANLDGATFKGCKFAGARGEPRSHSNLAITGADLGTRDHVLAALAESLSVDALLQHPGPLVAARDPADPVRVAVFVVGESARPLSRVAATSALASLRQGTTYGQSGFVWAYDDDSFTVWDFERKALEARGDSLTWPAGPIDRALVKRVASFINPDSLGNRGVKLVMPGYKYERIVVVQENDFRVDDNPSYTQADARRDGMWASHVGRDLAAWLGVPHDDEFA